MGNYPKNYRGGHFDNQNYHNQNNRQIMGNYAPPQYAPPPPKKSGAKYSNISKGKNAGGTIVNAWNKSKSKGLLTATVAPYDKSDEIVTAQTSGKEYIKMIAKVKYSNSGVEKIIPCLMNIKTKVIVLSEIGMVITPNGSGHTSSGKKATGYFGTMTKR